MLQRILMSFDGGETHAGLFFQDGFWICQYCRVKRWLGPDTCEERHLDAVEESAGSLPMLQARHEKIEGMSQHPPVRYLFQPIGKLRFRRRYWNHKVHDVLRVLLECSHLSLRR